MRFSTALSTLLFAFTTIAAPVANDKKIQLFAKSENQEINGKGISFLHEGAGISYAFLGTNAETLIYSNNQLVYPIRDDIKFVFGDDGGIVQIGVAEPVEVSINDNGELDFGVDKVYATKNIDDPYRYSQNSYAILTKEGGIPFTIEAKIQD